MTGMNEFLMIARRTDIRQMSLDVDYYANVRLQPSILRKAIAVDVDVIEGEHNAEILSQKGQMSIGIPNSNRTRAGQCDH